MKLFVLLFVLLGTCLAITRHGSANYDTLTMKLQNAGAQDCAPAPTAFTIVKVTGVDTNPQIKKCFTFGWTWVIQELIAQNQIPDATYKVSVVTQLGTQTLTTFTFYRFKVTLIGNGKTINIIFVVRYNTSTGELSVIRSGTDKWLVPDAPAIVTQTQLLPPTLPNYAWTAADANGLRYYTQSVTFPQPFTEVPNVGLVLAGCDNQVTQWNFDIRPQNITTTGFDILVTLYPNCLIYSYQPSYIATLTKYSGINIATSAISSTETDVAAIANVVGDRSITRQYADVTKLSFKSVKSVAFLSGVGILRNSPTLSVKSASDGSVTFGIWNITQFLRGAATVLYWDATKTDVYTTIINAGFDGPLYDGFGLRPYVAPFPTSPLQAPQVFLGVSKLFYQGGYNNRLKQEINPTNITIYTWYDSKLHEVEDNIFMTCQDATGSCVKK